MRPFFASFTDNFLARLFRCRLLKKFTKLHVRESKAEECVQVSRIFAMAPYKLPLSTLHGFTRGVSVVAK